MPIKAIGQIYFKIEVVLGMLSGNYKQGGVNMCA